MPQGIAPRRAQQSETEDGQEYRRRHTNQFELLELMQANVHSEIAHSTELDYQCAAQC